MQIHYLVNELEVQSLAKGKGDQMVGGTVGTESLEDITKKEKVDNSGYRLELLVAYKQSDLRKKNARAIVIMDTDLNIPPLQEAFEYSYTLGSKVLGDLLAHDIALNGEKARSSTNASAEKTHLALTLQNMKPLTLFAAHLHAHDSVTRMEVLTTKKSGIRYSTYLVGLTINASSYEESFATNIYFHKRTQTTVDVSFLSSFTL